MKSAKAILKLRQSRQTEKLMEQNKKLEEALQASVDDERHNILEIKQRERDMAIGGTFKTSKFPFIEV